MSWAALRTKAKQKFDQNNLEIGRLRTSVKERDAKLTSLTIKARQTVQQLREANKKLQKDMQGIASKWEFVITDEVAIIFCSGATVRRDKGEGQRINRQPADNITR